MLRALLTRLLAIALFVLSFSMVAWAAPAEGRNGLVIRADCTADCTTGTDTLNRLTNLNETLQPKYGELGNHLTDGTNTAPTVQAIANLFTATATDINGYPKDTTGALDEQAPTIANAAKIIAADIAAHHPGEGDETTRNYYQTLSPPVLGLADALDGVKAGLGTELRNTMTDLPRERMRE